MHCYLQCVEDCAEFEIPTMVIHLPDDDKPYNELGLYRLNKLCEKAGNLKIKIAFENLYNIMNLSYILDNIKSPYIGLCFDSCHQVRYYPDKDILSRYGDRLFALHLHDYNNDCIHRIPYDGISDWQDIMCKIKQTNYTGAVAIEAMNWGYPNVPSQKYLTMAFESAKKLVKLI